MSTIPKPWGVASPLPSPIASPMATKRPADKKLLLVLAIPAAMMFVVFLVAGLFLAGVVLQEYNKTREEHALKDEMQAVAKDFATIDRSAVLAEMGLKAPPEAPD